MNRNTSKITSLPLRRFISSKGLRWLSLNYRFSSLFAKTVQSPANLEKEGERLAAVLVDILLVRVLVVALAAVWVGLVAVRLHDGGIPRRALEARGPRSEL